MNDLRSDFQVEIHLTISRLMSTPTPDDLDYALSRIIKVVTQNTGLSVEKNNITIAIDQANIINEAKYLQQITQIAQKIDSSPDSFLVNRPRSSDKEIRLPMISFDDIPEEFW